MNDMNDDLDFKIDEALQALANVVAELIDLGVSEHDIKRQVDGVFEVYDPEGRRG
jgi:hypothetical protein